MRRAGGNHSHCQKELVSQMFRRRREGDSRRGASHIHLLRGSSQSLGLERLVSRLTRMPCHRQFPSQVDVHEFHGHDLLNFRRPVHAPPERSFILSEDRLQGARWLNRSGRVSIEPTNASVSDRDASETRSELCLNRESVAVV